MRCLNCNRDDLAAGTEICPQCGVHLPSLLRDVLAPGTLLNGGKYRIDHALGWGGFGITYLARHISLDQDVAIKEFYPRDHVIRNTTTGHLNIRTAQQESYQRALQRFAREGRTLARLNHPNVIRVRDHFEEHGTAYLVMELVSPSRTLREVLDAQPGKRLPAERVEQIASQLVGALEAVHAAGVYHLDVKPENILMTPAGQAIMIDFGASRQGLGTRTTQSFTLEYAPPEVLSSEDVGPESDLFELGMVVYEMLSGERPPSALARLRNNTWVPDNLTEPWRTLVSAATRLVQEERPKSVSAWWEARGAVRGPQTQPHQPPPPSQLPPTIRVTHEGVGGATQSAPSPPHTPASPHGQPATQVFSAGMAPTQVLKQPVEISKGASSTKRVALVVAALCVVGMVVAVAISQRSSSNSNSYQSSMGYTTSSTNATTYMASTPTPYPTYQPSPYSSPGSSYTTTTQETVDVSVQAISIGSGGYFPYGGIEVTVEADGETFYGTTDDTYGEAQISGVPCGVPITFTLTGEFASWSYNRYLSCDSQLVDLGAYEMAYGQRLSEKERSLIN